MVSGERALDDVAGCLGATLSRHLLADLERALTAPAAPTAELPSVNTIGGSPLSKNAARPAGIGMGLS